MNAPFRRTSPGRGGNRLPTVRALCPPLSRVFAPYRLAWNASTPLRNFKGLPLLTLAALVVLGAITFLGPSFGPRVENASATQATVTVKHGETLWDIAQSVNPGGDVRDTVVRIMEMNSLTSTAVDAGQRLEVPKPRH